MNMTNNWCSVEQTHRGKRRKNNEDAVMSRPDVGLWAVADGMGGHQAGDVASQAITNALADVRMTGPLAEDVDAIEDVLLDVNDKLRLHSRTQCQGGTVGSTVVALVAEQDKGVVLWAGDSRLYRLRSGRLEQVTRDHNPVSDLLDSGAVTEADALAAETNIITRAVGGQPELNLDVAVFDIAEQDTYLLCSDGLYRELGDSDLLEELGGEGLQDIATRLLERCLLGAARDNVSFVVARRQ